MFRNFVVDDVDVLWLCPLKFPPNLDVLSAMSHIVAQYTRKLDFVAVRRIGVEDHLAVLQQLVKDCLPFHLSDGTGALGASLNKTQVCGRPGCTTSAHCSHMMV